MGYITAQDFTSYQDERNNLWQPGLEKLNPPGMHGYMPEENVKHGGPGKDFFDLVQGKPVTFTDETGAVTVGQDGLNMQGAKTGVSLTPNSISVNKRVGDKGQIGASLIKEQQFDPYAKPTYAVTGNFSFGGQDPVKPFEGVQGLPEQKAVNANPEESAQEYLKKRIDQVRSDPNFRYHPL